MRARAAAARCRRLLCLALCLALGMACAPGENVSRAEGVIPNIRVLLRRLALAERADLPGAVGEALRGACDLLAKVDFETIGAKWDMLPPARLVRGWRALTAYRDITNARMLFDAAIDCIEDCIAARMDCADWLLAHAE